MKKLYPFIALAVAIAIAGLYGLDYYQKLRAQQRQQTSYLLSRCVNQSLLSMFRLQANDWKSKPKFYRQEAEALDTAIASLHEELLDGKPFAEWHAAVAICNQLTKNTNRHHQTIFRPLGHLVETELWGMNRLKDPQMLERREKALNRAKVAARAADTYLEDFRTDIDNLLASQGLSQETRAIAHAEIEQAVLSRYRQGSFSKRLVEQYLDRRQHFYQMLAGRPKSFTLRGGSLYFYDKNLRRQVEDLNRALLTGEVDFYNQWRQILLR